ncbi:5-methyltetrahydropteroyltriglutamate--homocysteine S-methyltransferase [Puniceicoccaceae bacterium K14]|nr:5-methyltetrahydropteroyltriglutamate--homocysteine S-methyltransferase [Puniceicoccaceae bacterium K14]
MMYNQAMDNTNIVTHNLGYPRIGANRELKKATEAYWKKKISLKELEQVGQGLRKKNWLKQQAAGIDLIPSNDFSFYDQTLDMSCVLGNLPPRFIWDKSNVDLDTYFLIARGKENEKSLEKSCDKGCKHQSFASEMTKWFDTNYHYITPEFQANTQFSYASNKVVDEFIEAKELGILTVPVIIGPVSYLTLGKVQDKENSSFDRFQLFDRLLPIYEKLIEKLSKAGAKWIQIDEPILSLDLNDKQRSLLRSSFSRLKVISSSSKLLLNTYFGPLHENLPLACQLDCDGLHIDGVRGEEEIEVVAKELPPERLLSLGIIDGRNIWKNNYKDSLETIQKAIAIRGKTTLALSPSCSLLHSPVSLDTETKIDSELKGWLAFADQKLIELSQLASLALDRNPQNAAFIENQKALDSRRKSTRIHNKVAKMKAKSVTKSDSKRKNPFSKRQEAQRNKLKLPPFPTTTIGSFPQTKEIRAARSKWKNGLIDNATYQTFLKEKTRECIEFQEKIDIDVLVHGEFERNDMVEYFGEQLSGFTFTENGWVQSYGSRCVKPPVIFGDVSRPKPMTVEWSIFAQSLTNRPMKGMLTGPVTILQWSFVRDDQPRKDTAKQIALAIRNEVHDLEAAGIGIIQIDEPAIREGLPLRRSDWQTYLDWAVEAFRLSACGVRDETQIHTHMCYSEFNDIIQSIAALDADVITIETSRSNMELLEAFVNFKYTAEIGPGVYDIHSPRIPEVEEMDRLMRKALQVLPAENLWVNPDCGLKTRGWKEVNQSLERMVTSAKGLRKLICTELV